jgi:hypothetical protein
LSASADGRRLLLDGPTLQVLTSTAERVAILSRSFRLENPGDAAISPDGSRVAYRRYGRLVLQRVRRGAEPAVVGRGGGSTPAWSPRGGLIAYGTPSEIRVADADGRHDVPIAPTFTQYSLAWSPDRRADRRDEREPRKVVSRRGRPPRTPTDQTASTRP